MKVLLTGAGGNLGRVLAPVLHENGYKPVLLDFRNIDTQYEFILGDIRDPEVMLAATKGIDIIIHAAALHGIHLAQYDPDEFWQLNVMGTRNVYQAALKNNVTKVIFCSSIDVYGDGILSNNQTYSCGTEQNPLLPNHIYGLTKKLGEELANYYYRVHGISTVSLRLGMFVAASDLVTYGFRLLCGGVDERDVADSMLLAIKNSNINNDAFNIVSDVPFASVDEEELIANPEQVIEKYYPGAIDIFKQNDIDVNKQLSIWGNRYWLNEKAKRELGFTPSYNFDGFLKALKEKNTAYYPFAGLPWWGIKDS